MVPKATRICINLLRQGRVLILVAKRVAHVQILTRVSNVVATQEVAHLICACTARRLDRNHLDVVRILHYFSLPNLLFHLFQVLHVVEEFGAVGRQIVHLGLFLESPRLQTPIC